MFQIRPFSLNDLEKVRVFTDHEIGSGYYSATELSDVFDRSSKNGIMCSFQLVDEQENVKGVRISYPAGNWNQGKGRGLCPSQWPHQIEDTAYFQSLFLARDTQAQGWGVKLSLHAIAALRKTGARGIVCHSWKESPNNSSYRYLEKLGFRMIAEHPLYWKDVNYNCTRCLKPPCQCTAGEMYLDLEERK